MTLARTLIAQYLETIDIQGNILDLGGSSKSNMYKFIKSEYKSITIVNFNEEYGCDIVADITKKIPVEERSYDSVLCLSVLEHIYKYENVIKETFRVLKDDGKAYFSIPFIYKIHASPYDYFRYTDTALKELFNSNGFSKVEVIPLGYGPYSSCYSLTEGLYPNIFKSIIKNISIFVDKIVSKYTNTYNKKTFPIMYFVIVKK